jgi:GT2 family glycosyltransferase
MMLSIVIVNWNTGELLSQCLDSIYMDPELVEAFEVWVVDNASTDGSAQAALEKYPQTKLIRNQQNPGFAAANNQAIRQARGDYLLLLNPDTILHPGAVRTMLDFLRRNPAAGAVGPRLLNPDRSLQYSCSPEPTLSREFKRLFHLGGVRPDGYYAMDTWDTAEPRSVDVLLGACILVRRQALEDAGLFEETYFMYSEEVDLCRRLRQKGWGVYWTPTAQVIHFGGQSTRQAAAEMFLQLYKSKIVYFRKHYGTSAAWVYKLILLAASLPRLAIGAVAWLEPSPRRETHLAIVRNYQRLIVKLPVL